MQSPLFAKLRKPALQSILCVAPALRGPSLQSLLSISRNAAASSKETVHSNSDAHVQALVLLRAHRINCAGRTPPRRVDQYGCPCPFWICSHLCKICSGLWVFLSERVRRHRLQTDKPPHLPRQRSAQASGGRKKAVSPRKMVQVTDQQGR